MYDQEKVLNFAKNDVMHRSDAVECLLDFSKGPNAMLVTTMSEEPAYFVPGPEAIRSADVLEIDGKIASLQHNYPIAKPNNVSVIVPPYDNTSNNNKSSSSNTSNTTSQNTINSISSSSRSVSSNSKTRAICSFCGKSFAHLGDHNKHRRRHTGERPYACELCPRRFAHASNLARHRRLHSGEKPFECTSCGRRFGRKDKLAVHVARRCCANGSTEVSFTGQSTGIVGEVLETMGTTAR